MECGEQIMRSLRERDIRTAVSNNWQAEFGMAPATEQGKMQHSCVSKDVYLWRSRITSFSCYNVTPLPENCRSTSLFINDSLKEDAAGD
jgi:hypothetical protein